MKTLKIISGTLGSLVLIIVIIFAYYGGFSRIKIQIKEKGGETLIYKELKGDYAQAGNVIDKMTKALRSNEKIQTYQSFGIYYDNPRFTNEENLRSDAGCILEKKDTFKLNLLLNRYKIKICPTKKYIIADFPYKGKLSILLSLFKVYPAIEEYVKLNGYNEKGSVMEIYDSTNKVIHFRKEIIPSSH